MKIFTLLVLLCSGTVLFAQNEPTYAQYMLNQSLYNPGFIDIFTRFSGTVAARKQYASVDGGPLTAGLNGHYNWTRNHGFTFNASNDHVNNLNTMEIGVGYGYHIWLNDHAAFGGGIKVGIQNRSASQNYIYFGDGVDPTLQTPSTFGAQVGAGLSFQSRNLSVGVSMPFILNNYFASNNYYSTFKNSLYANISYKLRTKSNNLVFTPSILAKAIAGSKINMSFDGHFLFSQLIWIGGGYRTDKTVAASVGLFLAEGLRIVYSYETSALTAHSGITSTHELSVSYAVTVEELPFAERLYLKHRKMSPRRNPNPHTRYGRF